jgi:hypothetical protein
MSLWWTHWTGAGKSSAARGSWSEKACFISRIVVYVLSDSLLHVSLKAHLHNTTSRIRFLPWRMKTIADATIPVHQFMAKFEMWHLYTHLFKYIRQDKNRIRLVVSCRWALKGHKLVCWVLSYQRGSVTVLLRIQNMCELVKYDILFIIPSLYSTSLLCFKNWRLLHLFQSCS